MDSLYIIIPAYNEAENIGEIIKQWYPIILRHNADGNSRLVILDDGSKDNTLELVKREVAKKEFLEVITRENSGHGATIYFGYQYAIESNADFIFQTDSDGQTLAAEFESFWNKRYDDDVIIGDRSDRQDGFMRKVVSFCLRLLVETVFKVKIKDTNTPYRLMSRQALQTAIAYIPKEYSLTNVGLTAVFASMAAGRVGAKNRINLSFKPITFKPRQAGVNSINIPKIIKMGIKAVGDLTDIKKKLQDHDKGES